MSTDPVSKLEGIGRETVLKLQDIQAAAAASPYLQDAVTVAEFTDTNGHVTSGTSASALCQSPQVQCAVALTCCCIWHQNNAVT